MASFPLAIVIPAYKARFLNDTLASIKAQQDERFQLYVCDDGSPDDLGAIHRAIFSKRQEDRRFIRFEENLGGHSLVQQWNRCVAQTGDEPWIWLFSDDDIASPHCVARFYQALAAGEGGSETNVYRFNTASINAEGALTEIHPPHPLAEMAVDFAYHRLLFQRRSFVSEYLFRRDAFHANGGFVHFPFALGSDDASWIVFTAQQPIITLSGALVYWRLGGENTSLLQGPSATRKLLALADFSRWMQDRFRGQSPSTGDASFPLKIDMEAVARQWFDRTMWSLATSFGYRQIPKLAGELTRRGLDAQGWRASRLGYLLLRIQAKAFVEQAKRLLKRAGEITSPAKEQRQHE